MIHLPVHWRSGMLLRPDHFIAADRASADALRAIGSWDRPYSYGWRWVSIDRTALMSNTLVVRGFEGRLRDGTMIRFEGKQKSDGHVGEPLTRSIPRGLEADHCYVRWGWKPLESIPSPAVRGEEVAQRAYKSVRSLGTPATQTQAGWNDDGTDPPREDVAGKQTPDEPRMRMIPLIEFRQPEFELTFGEEKEHNEAVRLPLLRLIRRGGVLAVDPNYIPPLLDSMTWEPQGGENWVGFRGGHLAPARIEIDTQIDALRSRLDNYSFPAGCHPYLGELLVLAPLARARFRLTALLGSDDRVDLAPAVHPFDIYLELCGLIGDLSALGTDPPGSAGSALHYDHDDIAGSFAKIVEQLKTRLAGLMAGFRPIRHPAVGAVADGIQ